MQKNNQKSLPFRGVYCNLSGCAGMDQNREVEKVRPKAANRTHDTKSYVLNSQKPTKNTKLNFHIVLLDTYVHRTYIDGCEWFDLCNSSILKQVFVTKQGISPVNQIKFQRRFLLCVRNRFEKFYEKLVHSKWCPKVINIPVNCCDTYTHTHTGHTRITRSFYFPFSFSHELYISLKQIMICYALCFDENPTTCRLHPLTHS